MISASDRENAVLLINEAIASGASCKKACYRLGITERTFYRWKKRKSDIKNTYIAFDELDEEAVQFIKSIAIYYVNNFEPSDKFGCCSKYKECSNAKKCLHENLFYSKACWYRKNLESGKIFFE